MKARIYFFSAVYAGFALMVACAPQHRDDDARHLKKHANGADEQNLKPLENLTDGAASFAQTCAQLNLKGTASETPVSDDDLKKLGTMDLIEAKIVAVQNLKSGEPGYVAGEVTGPFNIPVGQTPILAPSNAKVTCHNSKPLQAGTKGNVPLTEAFLQIPVQLNVKEPVVAEVTLQAREGKVGTQVKLFKAPAPDTAKVVTAMDTDKRLHVRWSNAFTGQQAGTGASLEYEAIYVPHK
jgi:hypothetical protein